MLKDYSYKSVCIEKAAHDLDTAYADHICSGGLVGEPLCVRERKRETDRWMDRKRIEIEEEKH